MPAYSGTQDLSLTIADQISDLIKAVPEINQGKVHFARSMQIPEDEMPCISVELGEDRPFDPDGYISASHANSNLEIDVDLYHRRTGDKALREILDQRALVHFAVMADLTLGLSFVVTTAYAGATRPVFELEGNLPGYFMTVSFLVHYRFNLGDRTVFTGS